MQGYATVQEKAVEWGISPRHVQYLCRINRITGAVKRAGSWFIPHSTPNPAKNTKTGDKSFRLLGTKKKIFDSAIELFTEKGFENVSLRDIAERIGIRQSTVYNHFESKKAILDEIYDFYCHIYIKNRPNLEAVAEEIKDKSIAGLFELMKYDFGAEYLGDMSNITKIILQRISIDTRAREIAKDLMIRNGLEYVEEVLDNAIRAGRLAPFNTHLMAVFINSVRIFTLFYWVLGMPPESVAALADDENALYSYGAEFIKDLKPPAGE